MSPKILILSALCAVLLSSLGSTSARFVQPKGYLGCFKDHGSRDLPRYVKDVSSIAECINLCRDRKYPYAGLQYYGQCRCGIDFGIYGKSGNCNLGCKSGGTCGGHWANSIYFVDDRLRKQHKGYLGCYADGQNRDLGTWAGFVRSMAECKKRCKDKRMKYAGVQYSSECRCGNNYGRYAKSKHPCDMFCTNGDICGGSWRNTVHIIW